MSEMLLGERGMAYRSQITGRRTYSLATVREVRPLKYGKACPGRAIVYFDLDQFDFGFMDYGPDSMLPGQRVEVYEFQPSGDRWLTDYVPLPPAPRGE